MPILGIRMMMSKKIIFTLIVGLWACGPLFSNSIILQEVKTSEEHQQCQYCHTKKSKHFVPGIKKPERNHWEKSLKHGDKEISCNHCHDVNNHNYLRSTEKYSASFEHPSAVCQRCHVDKFRDWQVGIHGLQVGGWNQDKTKFHCTHCHSPHSVPFKKMEAFPPPRRPRH